MRHEALQKTVRLSPASVTSTRQPQFRHGNVRSASFFRDEPRRSFIPWRWAYRRQAELPYFRVLRTAVNRTPHRRQAMNRFIRLPQSLRPSPSAACRGKNTKKQNTPIPADICRMKTRTHIPPARSKTGTAMSAKGISYVKKPPPYICCSHVPTPYTLQADHLCRVREHGRALLFYFLSLS